MRLPTLSAASITMSKDRKLSLPEKPECSSVAEYSGAVDAQAVRDLLARHPDARLTLESDGRLAVRFADGAALFIPFSAELTALTAGVQASEAAKVQAHSSSLDGDDGQVSEQSATPENQGTGEAGNQDQGQTGSGDIADLVLQGHAGSQLQVPSPFGRPLPPLGSIGDETTRHGRDGLKHGEMGSTGHSTSTGVGQGLGHLTGLSDESLGRRNGESLSVSENRGFPGEITGVGAGIDHLWLLGDTEYRKSSIDGPVGRDEDEDDNEDDVFQLANLQFPPPVLSAKAPRIAGAASLPEDGHAKMPLEIELANPGAEQIRSVVIGKPPAGTVIDWDHALPGTVKTLANGDIEITGGTSEIQAIVKSLEISPPHNFSGTLPLDITVTVTGYGTTAVATYPYPVAVTPIADVPDVTGDVQTTDEDTPVLLPNLAGNLNDLDGSEILGFEIRNVPAGASFQSGHVSPTDPTVWIFTPAEIAAGVTFVPTTDSTVTAFMKIRAIATEKANGDTKYVEDDVVVFINPLNGPHLTTSPADTNEDTQVDIGSHITPAVIDPDGSERMVSLVISNVPATATLAYTAATGIRVVATPTSYTIEADPAYAGAPMTAADIEQAIKTTLATVKLTPPPNSDADINLSITMNTHDTDGSDYSQTAGLTVAVHAVADQPTGSGSGGGDEDTFIKVPVTVSLADTDSSETIEFVEISGVPNGAAIQWINADNSTNTSGSVVFDALAGTIRITGTTAEIQARALALQVRIAADQDDDFTLSVRVGSIESNPTESGDVATLREETTFTVPVTVNAVADPVALGGSATVVEDHTVNFGAQITLTKADTNSSAASGPSSETITGVIIHDVPAAATVTYTAATGIRVVATATSFTVEADPAYAGVPLTAAQLEQAVRDTVASFSLKPPADSDLDITLGIDVTTVDRYGTADASSPLTTANLPFGISVKADADPATLTLDPARNAGQEDQPILVGFTVARTDTDPAQGTPSEAIQTVVIRDIPAGFTLATSPTTPGNAALLVANPDGSYTITGPDLANPAANDAAINDVLSHLTLTPAPGGVRQHVDDDFTLHVDVTTRENNLGGGQIETLNNTQTFDVPVTVAPVADVVTITPNSTVVEDHSAALGIAIEAGLAKADLNSSLASGPSSETITQVVVSGIPTSGAQIIAQINWPSSTAQVTTSFNVAAGSITFTLQPGATEQDLRDALKSLSLTPHLHTDVDIPLTVAVTTVDRWGTAEASAPLVTTLSHTLIVEADATNDQPAVTGAASGVEDTLIALPVTVTMQDTDGSETLAKVELTGIPHGAAVSWTGLPAGATATPIMSGADIVGYTFAPANATYAATTALQSFLASNLKITPPQDSGADFDLTVKAYNVESNLSGLGGSTGATPLGTGTIHVTVTPALDSVTLPATNSTVSEDLWVKTNEDGSSPTYDQPSVVFGSTIDGALTRGADKGAFDAADTTEGIGRIVLGNLPKDTATYTDPGASAAVRVVMSEDALTHIQTFTIEANPAYAGPALSSAALETAIRVTLATFTFTPAADDSTDVPVSVAVYTQDTDPDAAGSSIGLTLTASSTHTIVVNARADTPTVDGDSKTTDEDTAVALDLDAALRDHVGASEVLSVVITGVPAGASLSFTGAATVGSVTSGVTGLTSYTLTGSEAAIRDTLAHSVFHPTPQWSGTVNMTIAATATETGADDANAFIEPTADDTITVSAPIVVTITPVVDDIAMGNASTIVQENANSQSPTDPVLTINLGQRLALSTADLDGSQSLSLTLTGIRTDFTAAFGTSLAGVTTDTSTPGTVTLSGAHVQDVLTVLQSLTLTSASDSDADFTVHVAGSTNENALTPADAHAISFDHAVIVQAVADTPAVDVGAATKAFVDEDSGWVTYPVTVALNDSDGSESLASVVVQYSTSGAGAQPSVQLDPALQSTMFPAVVLTPGAGQLTLTGPTAQIEAALQALQVKPGTNNDADINITVTATAVESNPSEANSTGPGVAGTEISVPTANTSQSFVIPVKALADTPTLTIDSIGAGGVGHGVEDTDIPLALTAGHPDTADGSERIQNVVIAGVPAGFTLTSTGSGSLSYNAGTGNYTVTGASDAAINDTLAKLKLVIAPAGARLNLDTDFQLQVTVTSIESNPSESGAGQGGGATNSVTFPVDVAVVAVADGTTPSGSSVVVEDVAKVIGTDIHWTLKDSDGTENVTQATISGFAVGSTVTYTDAGGAHTVTIAATGDTITFTAPHTTDGSNPIRTYLDTLAVTAPVNSDGDVTLSVSLVTTDNDGSTKTDSYNHTVTVQAVADTPSVSASNISSTEDTADIPLVILPVRSSDQDGSETLSVLVSLPGGGSPLLSLTPKSVSTGSDALTVSGPVVVGGHNVYSVTGTHGGSAIGTVTITDNGNGTYLVQGPTVSDPATSTSAATAIDAVLGAGVLTLQTQAQWSGSLTGSNGIRVDAISTEAASGGQLAANSYGGADNTSKTETATTYIDVTLAPQVDVPTFSTSSTIVQENNNTTNDSQQLVIALGTQLNVSFADTDGSQSMTVTLAGIPTSASDGATIKFGSTTVATGVVGSTTISGVTVTTAADGSITLSAANANTVVSVLQTLTVQLASDSDKDFTVDISGSTTEALGGTSTFGGAGSPITHPVVVQAVADLPTVSVGSTTKPAVSEDSGWVTYPVTVALNDTDGTETLQSVRVQFSTVGSGNAPQVQFDPAQQAALFPNVVFTPASGQVTLTGPTAEIIAAMQYLQVKPGADNGENISISVRAISVESAPTETNLANGSGPGGAGAIGTEISIPTATTNRSFTIPVTPVPDTPSISAPAAVSGTEDVVTTIAGISISTTDTDTSETRYIEIKTSSFPAGSVFSNGSGTTVGSTVTDSGTGETWLRIAASDAATLRVLTPHDWSGVTSLEVRGVIVDHSASQNIDVTTTTASQTIALTIAPVADAPLSGDASQGTEDTIVNFGADIADLAHADHSHGVHVEDTTKGPATEGGVETISQLVLTVPADTATLTYTVTHGAAVGTASIVQVGNIYTITSSIITGAADLGALSDAQRTTAESDIRQTLAAFNVLMGVTHTDQNGAIQVTATTLDVKNGTASTTTASYSHPITILAVADTPAIDAGFSISGSENGAIPLVGTGADLGKVLLAHRSADTDGVADAAGWGSEVLSVEISGVPSGSNIGLAGGYSLPAGAALSDIGGGTYRVTGANVNDINAVLSHLAFNPVDYAGNLVLSVTAITTEQGQAGDPDIGSGAGISVKTATAVGTISLSIAPSVDAPAVKGNAIGLEDNLIAVPVSVTLADKDQTNGTETYVMKVANDLPTTTVGGVTYQTKLYGAAGAQITLDGDGTFHLTAADIAVLKVLPPLNYSSALQGDIVLHTTTVVTDTAATGVATASFTKDIPIAVTGVADKPGHYTVTVNALEDQPIGLGHAIVAAAGSLTAALVDTDGSEKLSFVIGGLPTTVIPSIDAAHGRLDYIGGGKWSVSATSIGELTLAMESLTLPAKVNFSGDNPYAGLTVEAVSQELDSDQATSDPWPVTIHVQPVLDPSLAIDGLSGWSPGAARSEDQISGASTAGLSLASISSKTYVDDDGSEKVTRYDVDLSKLYSGAPGDTAYNAQIDAKSSALFVISGAGTAGDWSAMPAAEKAQWFIDHYATGTFTSHTGDAAVAIGHIVITEAQLDANGQSVDVVLASGLAPSSSPFFDSNVDFTIPVTATIRDSAVISGSTVTVTGTQSVDFGVTLAGVADTPTVFAVNPQNWATDPTDSVSVDTFAPLQLIALDMGGHSTDTDVTQGRTLSEDVYYVLSLDSATSASGPVTPPTFALTDGTGAPIGLDNGDGTWLIRKSDVTIDAAGKLLDLSGNPINLQTSWFSGPPTTLNFSLTTVAVENDTGNRATNSTGAQFAVIVDPGMGGSGGTAPPPPTIDMTHLLVGTEDTSSPVASTGFVTASAGTASVAVMFTLPAGASITNATYNPLTGRWVAAMDDVNNGLVHITPPHDFSGVLDIPVEAVATGTNLMKAATSAVLHMPVVPVADGVRVTSAPDAGLEDTAVSLHLALGASPTGNAADIGEVDIDGSETKGSTAYVRLDNGATLIGSYTVVGAGDPDATIDGHSVVGYARVPYASLATLQALPASNWHGTIGVTVVTVSTDQLTYTDPATGNPVSVSDDMASAHAFSVPVTAVADAPLLTVPATTPGGSEDNDIALTDLAAALADTITANGGEILSVKISGVPSGTTFNFGSNNGDGSWTIPSDKLSTLTVKPPLNFSGTMHLALEAYAIESSNGDTAHSSLSFDVSVTPVADTFEILAKDVSVTGSGLASLDLNVRMVDQNALTGAGGAPTYTGETLPEIIRMTFGSVPTGMFLVPSSGGELRDLGSGSWTFTGTQSQANALQIASGPGTTAGTVTVTISAVSLDGASTLATPITDTFRLTVAAPTTAGATYTGTTGADVQDWSAHTGNDIMLGDDGNDTLLAGSGINRIAGGKGSDTMTGGSGSDTYLWNAGDDAGGALDVITNFQLGLGKDHLDLSRLLTGFNQQTSNLDNFVKVKGDGQTIQVDASGSGASFHDVVTLQGAALTQPDLHTMVNNGNLIV